MSSAGKEHDRGGLSWSEDLFLELLRGGLTEKAFVLLLAQQGRLRGYLAGRYGVGPMELEPLIHEATWKAIERVGAYRPETWKRTGLSGWAFQVGVNHAVDRLREELARRQRERAVARPESVEENELPREVREAIARLASPFREILLCDLEHGGLAPNSVVAALPGIEASKVPGLRREARRRLKEELE